MLARYWFLLCVGQTDFVFARVLKTMQRGDKIVEFFLDIGDRFEDQTTVTYLFDSKESCDKFFKKVEGFGFHIYGVAIYINKPKNVIEALPFSCESEFTEFANELSKTVLSNVEKRVSTYVV